MILILLICCDISKLKIKWSLPLQKLIWSRGSGLTLPFFPPILFPEFSFFPLLDMGSYWISKEWTWARQNRHSISFPKIRCGKKNVQETFRISKRKADRIFLQPYHLLEYENNESIWRCSVCQQHDQTFFFRFWKSDSSKTVSGWKSKVANPKNWYKTTYQNREPLRYASPRKKKYHLKCYPATIVGRPAACCFPKKMRRVASKNCRLEFKKTGAGWQGTFSRERTLCIQQNERVVEVSKYDTVVGPSCDSLVPCIRRWNDGLLAHVCKVGI